MRRDRSGMHCASDAIAGKLLSMLDRQLIAGLLLTAAIGFGQGKGARVRPNIPRVWDASALADWATPLAGINVRPTHLSPAQYYSLPVDNLKTWPVYLPGKEPAGYWEMLQKVGPLPMIEPEKLKTEADWIAAGRSGFAQMDHLDLRTLDPGLIAIVIRGGSLVPLANGTAANVRWVPTRDGVGLGFPNCSACHGLVTRTGEVIDGAPAFSVPVVPTGPSGPALVARAHRALRFVDGGSPVRMGPGPFGMWLYSAFGVPWVKDDVHARLKDLSEAEFAGLIAAGLRGGALPRWNGSPFFPTKVPDLTGIKDRKFIDHTATHLNRGIGDLMRYSALVSTAESTTFGAHDVLLPGSELPGVRRSDET